MRNVLLLFIFFSTTTSSLAQTLQQQWQIDLPVDGRNKELKDIQQAFTGELLLVGTSALPKGEKDGLLVFVDPEKGAIVRKQRLYKEFNQQDDVIQSIVQLEDGGFFLLGTTFSSRNTVKSWLIRTDEFGKQLNEIALEAGSLEKMVLLADNSLLLVGKKTERADKLWVVRFERDRIERQFFYLEEGWKDLTINNIVVTATNEVLICGNAMQRLNQIVWTAKLNDKGELLSQHTFEQLAGLQSVSPTFDGNLLLAGGTDATAWIGEIQQDATLDYQSAIPFDVFQRGEGVLRNYKGDYLLLTQTFYDNQYKANYLRSKTPTFEFNLTEAFERFSLSAMHHTFQQQYIIGGIAQKDKFTTIRVYALKDQDSFALAKSSPKIEVSKPILKDENGDGILSPEERAAIVFTITNKTANPLISTKVRVEANEITGVNYSEEVFVSYLAANGQRKVSVPFNATMQLLKNQQLDLILEIRERGQLIKTVPFTVKTESNTSIIVEWDDIGERTIRSEKGVTNLKLKILSEQQLRTQDIKAYVNGTILDNSKDASEQLVKPEFSEFFTYSRNIPLQEGENTIYFEVVKNGERVSTKSLTVFYEPNKPNLHVLAIGPTYKDLKFNGKDAIDFSEAMKAQQGKGLFNQVFVKALTTTEETNKRSLSIAFADLYKRFMQREGRNKITKNDVLIVFISSHGELINNRFNIVPSDFDSEFPIETGLDYRDKVLHYLELINCKKLVFIDACHSGGASKSVVNPAISKALIELNQSINGMSAITSCSKNELSFEHEDWENGAFTKALLEALKGESTALTDGSTIVADQAQEESGNGMLSIEEIYLFLKLRVPDIVQSKGKTLQNPKQLSSNLPKHLNFFVLNQ